MATSTLSNDDFHTNSDDQHLEIFGLIWLDADVNIKEIRNTEQQLRSIINHLKKFQDVKQCQQYIEERSQKDRLVLIVSGRLGREIVPSIHKLRQVISIYVYCMDKKSNEQWSCEFAKVKAVVVELDELVSRIKTDHKIQKKVEEPLSISVLNTSIDTGKSTIGVNGEFVFSQVLIDCLLRLKSTQTDINELINCLKNEYEERVLFEIDADPRMVKIKPFADISALSKYADESEVLFMLGSIFRLQSIDCDHENDQIWIIRMTLCGDDEHDLKHVLMYMKQQIGSEETNLRTLGKLLWKMGKFHLAGKYFDRLLKELPPNDPLISSLYEDLGELASQTGSYDMSIQWYQKSLIIKNQNQLTVNFETNKTNSWIGPLRAPAIDIHPNATWRQDDITVAGGNGKGSELTQLDNPHGLYVDDDQTIYVADYLNHRIVAWKYGATSGQVVAGGDGQGNGTNQLDRPHDVIVDKERDSLIISDAGNYRVVRWPRRNGASGETIISHIDCMGLTLDQTGSLYVSDFAEGKVLRYRIGDFGGTMVAGSVGIGHCIDQLYNPCYVFVDQDRSVYVSDSGNYRVMKWEEGAKEGIVVESGPEQINDFSKMHDRTGVVVDQLNTVYVADYYNHRIIRWPKGATQGSIIAGGNGRGKGSNQLFFPQGLSFDRYGNLYVADQGNFRVQKFNIKQMTN
ncbi:unnamed protein product [Rotaria sp. Silwood1]|nr:unnamed protein product [Rotaria sp. Silwood1]